MYCREEIVLTPVEGRVGGVHAGGDELRDATLYELLGGLWVFELLAYCDAPAGTDELGEICVEGVVGESGELDILRGAVGTPGEGDAEDSAGGLGIVGECLVEVAHTEKEYGVGMLLLHLDILLHQRGFSYLGHFRAGY